MTETNQDKKNNNDNNINNFLTNYLIKIYKELHIKYSIDEFNYNLMICNNLVENNPSHLLSLFKDMQLYEISTEYLRRFYESDESNIRLRNICDFYESYSKIFPNYNALPEKDFIFKNIKKKKKIIEEKNKKIEKEISNGYKGINDVFFDKKVEKEMKKLDENSIRENEDSLFQNNLSISIISKNKYPAGDIENGKVGESVIMNNNSSVIENSTMSIEKGILNVLDDSKVYPKDLANLIKNDINENKKNNKNNSNKINKNNKKTHMKSNDILSPGKGNFNNNNKVHNNKYYSGSNKKNINHNDKSKEKKDVSRDNTNDKIVKNKDDKFNLNKKKKSLNNNNKNENQLFSPQPSRRNLNNKTNNKNVSNYNTINPSRFNYNKDNKDNKENKDNKDNKENKDTKNDKKNQKMFKTLTINDTNKILDKKKDLGNNNTKKNKLTKQNSNIVGMREKDKEKISSAFKTKHIYKRNRECLLSDNINAPVLSLGNNNKEDVSLININNKTINNNNKKSIIYSSKKTGLIKRNSFDKRRELFSPKHFKTKTETSISTKNFKLENKIKIEENTSPTNKNSNNNIGNNNKTINNTPEKSSLTEHKDSTTIESKGFLTSTPSATNINCKPLAIKVNRKIYITKKSTDNID